MSGDGEPASAGGGRSAGQLQLPVDQLEPDQELPDQLDPDQELPDHELPLQLLPDQLDPLHELPLHELPLHELPDQLEPDHELPDQVLPFQVPPDHELPAASSAAIAAESNGWPKMSCSPERTTPSRVRCSEPRASSREPVPDDGFASEPFFIQGVVASIFVRSTSPWPSDLDEKPLRARALLRNRYLRVTGSIDGYRCRARAAAPETNAAASLVPLPRK